MAKSFINPAKLAYLMIALNALFYVF